MSDARTTRTPAKPRIRSRTEMSPSLCGVYNHPERMGVLREMEEWLGRTHAVGTVFAPWHRETIDGLFEDILPTIWKAGRVPLLTWEPYTETPDDTPADVAARIAAGEFDAYLDAWTGRLCDWLAGPDDRLGTGDDRRLYLRLAHEMNGDWYPWSPAVGGGSGGTGTPDEYIGMWRHVHDRLARGGIGSEHLQWVWCVNHADVGAHAAEECYPGDEYVDWIGVDGFNWGASREWSAWRSPRETFSGMFDRLDALADKPVCVPEVACSSLTETGHDPSRKAAWIREAVAYLDDHTNLWCWFNEDKETDWAAFGGARGTHRVGDGTTRAAYAAYRDALDGIGGSKPTEAARIDGAAFRGD